MINITNTQWRSEQKTWNYDWKLEVPGKTYLVRSNTVLSVDIECINGPESLLTLLELINNPEKYKPILEHDMKLKEKMPNNLEVEYIPAGIYESSFSFIYRDLFDNVVNTAEKYKMDSDELKRNRETNEIPELIGFLNELEKNKISKETKELIDYHIEFCKTLIENDSGLKVVWK